LDAKDEPIENQMNLRLIPTRAISELVKLPAEDTCFLRTISTLVFLRKTQAVLVSWSLESQPLSTTAVAKLRQQQRNFDQTLPTSNHIAEFHRRVPSKNILSNDFRPKRNLTEAE